MNRNRILFWTCILVGIICVLSSLYLQNLYILRVAVFAVIAAMLAVSVNLLVGYTGQVSLGQAGFYGIGAYTVGVLTTQWHWSFWLALLAAFILTSLTGLILGLPTTQLKGHFLGIATLGFGIIVNVIFNNWTSLTGGPNGIRGIAPPELFGISLQYENYFLGFSLFCLMVVVLLVHLVVNSAIGRAWKCIRHDEISAQVSGINVYGYKLMAFSLSGGIAGIAGGLYAGFMTFISPETFDLNQSITIITTAILGGPGTLFGPLVGAGVLTVLSESLRALNELRLIIYGAILVTVIVFLPEGIYPFISKKLRKRGIASQLKLKDRRRELDEQDFSQS
ncbi:branched-chain amino acid ABC transporter permease [Fictibacillus sp. KU28468]|uniref:branched-chain amino acid ABC transporter permease n=1 Tax=Fictibacillus sp. KU28468 TaxID=2991053 RepID=UPI00223E4384|nr:branched-chain amino acid ABC transporter permease [Fictibacillus sp. KU28468]UZJ80540.1 branched-chain amino acid ABC transporter permease [Fictibacillus sp. KU28468]